MDSPASARQSSAGSGSDSVASASGASQRLAAVSTLLETIDAVGSPASDGGLTSEEENRLVQVRLGIASSLFAALRGKHEPTAQHCLRVALACSAWAQRIGLDGSQRDALEVAALLHDVGKVAVPDEILMKSAALSTRETVIMDAHWDVGHDILRQSCALPEVLDIVHYGRSWFDGTRHSRDRIGEQIPLGARMLAIVDAFDAMMTDHSYRRSLSLERAYHELYKNTGTQFDPALVALFIKLFECEQLNLSAAARRWLVELDPEVVNSLWRRSEKPQWTSSRAPESIFQQKLLDNMSDAVVFLDNTSRILLWNRGAERLTGISAHSVYQQMWLPSLLQLRNEQGVRLRDEDCPVSGAIRSGVQWLHRLTICGRGGRDVSVDAHAVPVIGTDGIALGLTLLLHDVSPEISLEQRCRSLHELATKDPLTQVANRAEFDRVHELFVAAHRESNRPCSLVMADIDRFKQVNDTYGHQAGDEVIQNFARLLQNSCRRGDLVARYGGEEFVMLCADCDNTTAARRADEIRQQFAEVRHPSLSGTSPTVSFGVTEIQPGDTTETMLRRADRALLISKQSGRNRVTQLGSGGQPNEAAPEESHDLTSASLGGALLVQELMTESPVDRSIEKLRGFIADHHAQVVSIDGGHLRLKIGGDGNFFRRNGERPIRLIMDVEFEEERTQRTDRRPNLSWTRIRLKILPQKGRDRRQAAALHRARQLLVSFRAYLMAAELSPKIEAHCESPSGGWWKLPWKRGVSDGRR